MQMKQLYDSCMSDKTFLQTFWGIYRQGIFLFYNYNDRIIITPRFKIQFQSVCDARWSQFTKLINCCVFMAFKLYHVAWDYSPNHHVWIFTLTAISNVTDTINWYGLNDWRQRREAMKWPVRGAGVGSRGAGLLKVDVIFLPHPRIKHILFALMPFIK